mmetsp:Transcript_330/g.1309  ORF Transcript_330/g.1309 Transcript_330/m.1309 type:complete len:241 (+) Transcript_330:1708-2430(+)
MGRGSASTRARCCSPAGFRTSRSRRRIRRRPARWVATRGATAPKTAASTSLSCSNRRRLCCAGARRTWTSSWATRITRPAEAPTEWIRARARGPAPRARRRGRARRSFGADARPRDEPSTPSARTRTDRFTEPRRSRICSTRARDSRTIATRNFTRGWSRRGWRRARRGRWPRRGRAATAWARSSERGLCSTPCGTPPTSPAGASAPASGRCWSASTRIITPNAIATSCSAGPSTATGIR